MGKHSHRTDTKRPRRRFENRPNGRKKAPVIRCNWCKKTFSGWPGTESHGLTECAWYALTPNPDVIELPSEDELEELISEAESENEVPN